jgi:hypothetical protein
MEEESDGESWLTTCWRALKGMACDRRWQAYALGGVVLIVALFWILRPSSRDDLEWEELLGREAAELIAVAPNAPKRLTLVASDAVKVVARDGDSHRELFNGSIRKGASEEIIAHGNVQISFSDGEFLSIRRENGETIRPSKPGKGWVDVAY